VSVHYILIAGLGVDTKTHFIAVTIIIAILTDIKIFS
jgi:heme/copper-type cytochrome/quinol oxidase subunit 1